jgi:hypothetical protein
MFRRKQMRFKGTYVSLAMASFSALLALPLARDLDQCVHASIPKWWMIDVVVVGGGGGAQFVSTRRFDSLVVVEERDHVADALWLGRMRLWGDQIAFGLFGPVIKVPNEPHNYHRILLA